MDEYGSTVVHAPPNSGLEIVATAPTIHNYGFLDLEDDFKYDNESSKFKIIDTDKEDIFAKYSFDGVEY